MTRVIVHIDGENDFELDLTDEQLAAWQAHADARGLTLDDSLAQAITDYIASHPIIAQTRTPQ